MSKSTKGLSPWITVGILVFSAMISTFNETILNVGFLAISEEFSITVNTAQWLVTGYMLVTSVMVPISAFLYTKYNTRTLFIFAMSVLLITDIGCFFAVNFPMLFAMRLVQAVGNGLIIPIMMNTALIVAPRDKIGTAMALCASGVTVGPGFGPVVSGVLMDFFNWRAIFVLMAVLIAAALVLGLAFVGNYSQEKKTKINVPSVVLCTVGLSLFLYGINSLTSSTASSLCFIAVGVIVLGIFVFLQGRVENPMLDFTPLKLKYFRRNTYIVSFSMFLNFMLSTLTPSYLQGAFGVGTMLSALLLLPGVLSNAVITAISGRILDKHGTRVLLPLAFSWALVMFLIQSHICMGASLALFAVGYAVLYMSFGFAMSPGETGALATLPKELNADGVSIINTFIQVAAGLSAAFFTGIMSTATSASVASGAGESVAMAYGYRAALLAGAACSLVAVICGFLAGLKKEEIH